jgi:hypothetical protein
MKKDWREHFCASLFFILILYLSLLGELGSGFEEGLVILH